AGGPAVTVGLFSIAAVLTWLGIGGTAVQFDPFSSWSDFDLSWGSLRAWLDLTFRINWGLFLFNLWPMYPMDGGRMMQAGLWWKLGYRRSMNVATAVGMVAAIVMGFVAIMPGFWSGRTGSIHFNMLFIAIMGYVTCLQERQAI